MLHCLVGRHLRGLRGVLAGDYCLVWRPAGGQSVPVVAANATARLEKRLVVSRAYVRMELLSGVLMLERVLERVLNS